MSLIVLLIFLIPLGLSAVLILRGLRGYRVGDHPICRRCGFDLFGLPGGTAVCGECGRSLIVPGSVVIGRRKRRPSFVVAGTVILLPMLFVSGIMVWRFAANLDWYQFVPVAQLERWAASANPATRDPALNELTARLNAGQLTANQLDYVIKTGLAYQANQTLKWDPNWGDLLESAQANGRLSAARWRQYVSQATAGAVGVSVRNRVRMGDPLCFSTNGLGGRTSNSSRLCLEMSDVHIVWPDVPDNHVKGHGFGFSVGLSGIGMGGVTDGSQLPASEFPSGLKPGPVTMHVVGHTVAGPTPTNGGQVQPVVTGTLNIPVRFTLLPADQSSVATIRDPSLALAIQKSIRVSLHPDAGVTVMGNPVGVGFDVIVRSGGVEHLIGSFACPAGTSNWNYSWGNDYVPARGERVDVLLRSNPSAAAATTDTFQMWEGELIYKDVVVR